jgi:small subunit ribosomal protein S20
VANTKSAKKEINRTAARASRNRSVRSAVRTRLNRVRREAGEGVDDLTKSAAAAVSALDRAVSKGILHKNNAARRKSRLAKRLSAQS